MTDMVTASPITNEKHKCIPACRITPLQWSRLNRKKYIPTYIHTYAYILNQQFNVKLQQRNSQDSLHSSIKYFTLTELFLCFFFSCQANARVELAKVGNILHSSQLHVVLCIVVCKCVLYYCHRVSNQFHLINITISISIR